jgi:predicted MFS family arabinose efflux permease
VGALGLGAVRAALSQRNYAIYTAGNVPSLIGTWMQRIAVGWLAWQLTGSGFWLGAVAFADLFPSVVFGPIAGTVSDRHDRMRVAKTSQVLAMLQSFTLALMVTFDRIDIHSLVAMTFLLGVITAFNQPARLAMIPSIVGREHLPAAIALNSIVFNSARFIGPAAAGAAILAGGTELAFYVNASAYIPFLVALTLIRLNPEPMMVRKPQGLWKATADGFVYAARHPGIGPMLVMMMVAGVFSRPMIELLPGYAEVFFGLGAEGLAALSSSVGIGAVVGGVWMAARGRTAGIVTIALAGHMIGALAAILFAATSWLPLGMAAAAAFGVGMTTSGIGTQTVVQLAVAPDMRGRVVSLYGVLLRGAPAIGALMLGTLSDLVGKRAPLIAGAMVTVVAVLIMARMRRRLAETLEAPPA